MVIDPNESRRDLSWHAPARARGWACGWLKQCVQTLQAVIPATYYYYVLNDVGCTANMAVCTSNYEPMSTIPAHRTSSCRAYSSNFHTHCPPVWRQLLRVQGTSDEQRWPLKGSLKHGAV